jgi:hypothetical protein
MSESAMGEGQSVATGESSAGEAQRLDALKTALRAEESALQTQEELDARQRRLSTRRRWGGPNLDQPAPGAAAGEAPPDVPPTETEEPPPA